MEFMNNYSSTLPMNYCPMIFKIVGKEDNNNYQHILLFPKFLFKEAFFAVIETINRVVS